MQDGNKWFYFNYDKRGSTTVILSPDGSYKKDYYYDTFGNTEEGGGSFYNETQYTGAINDRSTGMYYMNARYYNPSTGRFRTQDKYSGNPYDPWTQNLYAYCGNNPVNFLDPTGYGTLDDFYSTAPIGGGPVPTPPSDYEGLTNPSSSSVGSGGYDQIDQAGKEYFNNKQNVVDYIFFGDTEDPLMMGNMDPLMMGNTYGGTLPYPNQGGNSGIGSQSIWLILATIAVNILSTAETDIDIKTGERIDTIYYPAMASGGGAEVFLDQPLSEEAAVVKVVEGWDIYTYDGVDAYYFALDNGFGLDKIEPEIHLESPGIQYFHYHDGGHTVHFLFGVPFIDGKRYNSGE